MKIGACDKVNVVHLLSGGNVGGIETLCKDFALHSVQHNTFLFLWEGGAVADEMLQCGIDVVQPGSNRKQYIALYKKVRDICREKKADVVIAHHADPFSHFALMRLKREYPSLGTVAYAHGNAADMCRARRKVLSLAKKILLKRSLNRADRIVAISESVRESLLTDLGVSRSKTEVVYNGVDASRFNPAEGNAFPVRQWIYVGRLIEEKGVQEILKALARLKDIDYCFSIAGDGPYRKELQKLADELGISGRVKFLGVRRDVPDLLRQSGIFLHMPVWEEGFGITVVEAMASGLICVCAGTGALPEIIEDGKSGYLVKEANSDALAAKLREITALSEDEKQRIRNQAAERAKFFSVERFTAHLDRLITEVRGTETESKI